MDLRAILAGLAFALIWSSAFTSARIIVADAPPIFVAVSTLSNFWPDWYSDCAYAGSNLAADAGAMEGHDCIRHLSKCALLGAKFCCNAVY